MIIKITLNEREMKIMISNTLRKIKAQTAEDIGQYKFLN